MNTKTYSIEIIESIMGADWTPNIDNAYQAQIQYAMDAVDYQNERIEILLSDAEADIQRIRKSLTSNTQAHKIGLHIARDLDEAVTTRNLNVRFIQTMTNAVKKENEQ